MSASEEDLIREFTRIIRDDSDITVQVAVIRWPGPAEPAMNWEDAVRLPQSADAAEIQMAQDRLLKNRRYFSRCTECGETQIKGHMWRRGICMGCAERNHGVMF
jgi:hypothetical protein